MSNFHGLVHGIPLAAANNGLGNPVAIRRDSSVRELPALCVSDPSACAFGIRKSGEELSERKVALRRAGQARPLSAVDYTENQTSATGDHPPPLHGHPSVPTKCRAPSGMLTPSGLGPEHHSSLVARAMLLATASAAVSSFLLTAYDGIDRAFTPLPHTLI